MYAVPQCGLKTDNWTRQCSHFLAAVSRRMQKQQLS